MTATTTTYWYRDTQGTSGKDVLMGIDSEHELYASREEAEQTEPDTHYYRYHTYEITVTDHGPAPEPTWWWVDWRTDFPTHGKMWASGTGVLKGPQVTLIAEEGRTHATARVLATSEADARAKAIDAWREAGFLPVLERAGLEVEP